MHPGIERIERNAQRVRGLVGGQDFLGVGRRRDDDRRRRRQAPPALRPHAMVGEVAQRRETKARERLDKAPEVLEPEAGDLGGERTRRHDRLRPVRAVANSPPIPSCVRWLTSVPFPHHHPRAAPPPESDPPPRRTNLMNLQ